MAQTQMAWVKFLKWSPLYEKERPFQIFMNLRPESRDQRKDNLNWHEKQIEVTDIRAQADEFQLDTHGFTMRELHGYSQLQSLSEYVIVREYLPAVKEMLQSELRDVGTVFIYDWRLRSSDYSRKDRINFSDRTEMLLPSNFAHIDLTPAAIMKRIEKSFPSCAQDIMRQRIRAINVWKPLNNPVEQWPLAVCDGRTVKFEDLVETDSIQQGSNSSVYYAKYAAGQKWYYLDRQTPEEALIFKHFDSDPGVSASYTVHASIRQDSQRADAMPRHSIEVRTLCFAGCFVPEASEGNIGGECN
ncbi:hypothetical protein GGR57DRAFT_513129 [Xylariaceae sp. FL1272]|nr:hypothetical protein GGR57DRAFT_513129 [Xylariaceae sp. FL1272]